MVRIGFLHELNTLKLKDLLVSVSPQGFFSPPYWAAILISNLREDTLKDLEVHSPSEECDIYCASFKEGRTVHLDTAKKIYTGIKRKNPNSYFIIGGWGPTLSSKEFSTCCDVIVTGVFGEAVLTFQEILDNWNGEITNLQNIKGIYTKEYGFNEPRATEPLKPVDWEMFCQLCNEKLSSYAVRYTYYESEKEILMMPVQVAPFTTCGNIINLSNTSKFVRMGCKHCGEAYRAVNFYRYLSTAQRLDLVQRVIPNTANRLLYTEHMKKELVSMLEQLKAENFKGYLDIFASHTTLTPEYVDMYTELMKYEHDGKKTIDFINEIDVPLTPELVPKVVETIKKKNLPITKFHFIVDIDYCNNNDLLTMNKSFRTRHLKEILNLLEHEDLRFYLSFKLTTPYTGKDDFETNLRYILTAIGKGLQEMDATPTTRIGNNWLGEIFNTERIEYKIKKDICPVVESYVDGLNLWLREQETKKDSADITQKEISEILGPKTSNKVRLVMSLLYALNRLFLSCKVLSSQRSD